MLVFLAVISLFCVPLFLPPQVLASATEYRDCETNSTCTIGEFLYDDSYVPITNATCKLTSRDSTGAIVLNSINLVPGTDGWYAHDLPTATLSAGLYRSAICCTTGSQTLCLDKTFTVGDSLTPEEVANAVWDEPVASHSAEDSFGANLQNPTLLPADIWSYPSRSLTSFGSLVSDIWSSASRTLTGLGATISDIWGYASRTLTGATLSDGSLSEHSDIDNIEAKLQEQQVALEKLVNKPIITTFIEENQEFTSLESKLRKTREVVGRVYNETQNLKTALQTLTASWEKQTTTNKRASLTVFSQVLGVSTEAPDPESLSGQIDWLANAWEAPVIASLVSEQEKVLGLTKLASLKLNTSGQAADLMPELEGGNLSLAELEAIIGASIDSSSEETLFGLLGRLEQVTNLLDTYEQEINEIIANSSQYTGITLTVALDNLAEKILKINQVPNVLVILDNVVVRYPENRAFALKAIISINKAILTNMAGHPATHVWLENGSIVYKSLVTNPSSTLKQKIPIKFYLPSEVQRENIISLDARLRVTYDAAENALVCEGEVELGPLQSTVLVTELEDIWKIPAEEIAALRKQNETLFQPLKNTSYFAQGATLKADIDVALDKIESLQVNDKTPESRIRAYREAMLEINGIKSKLEDMKTLVASAGSVGTVFGFVGGVQTLAVWGLILVLVTGFIFLAVSMRSLARRPVSLPKVPEAGPSKTLPKLSKGNDTTFVIHLPKKRLWLIVSGIMVMVVALVIAVVLLIALNLRKQTKAANPVNDLSQANSSEIEPISSPAASQSAVLGAETILAPGEVLIFVPEHVVAVNIRLKPAVDADIVKDVVVSTVAKKTGQSGGWVGVEFTTKKGRLIEGWVDHRYIQETKGEGL